MSICTLRFSYRIIFADVTCDRHIFFAIQERACPSGACVTNAVSARCIVKSSSQPCHLAGIDSEAVFILVGTVKNLQLGRA